MTAAKKLDLARTTLRNAGKKYAAVTGARRPLPDAARAAGLELDEAARAFVDAELEVQAEVEHQQERAS